MYVAVGGVCGVCVEVCVLGHGWVVCWDVCVVCVLGRVWCVCVWGGGAVGESVYRSLRFIIRIPW